MTVKILPSSCNVQHVTNDVTYKINKMLQKLFTLAYM